MFSSENMLKDMNRSNFKHVSAEGQFLKADSGFFPTQNPSQPTQQQQPSGLARYRSAPSSFFATLLNSDTDNSSSGDDESEALFSAFMNESTRDLTQKNDTSQFQNMQYGMKQESGVGSELQPGYGQTGYESVVNVGGGAVVGSYSVGMESQVHHLSNGNRNCSNNLARQSSSPAGFLHGFSISGEVGNYSIQNHGGESSSLASGLNNHRNFSSGPSSSLRFMPTIPEAGNECIETRSPGTSRLRNSNSANDQEFEASAVPHDSWNESLFSGLKRNREDDLKMFSNFNQLESQNGETTKRSAGLMHHLSLPKTSSEMAEVEKYLQFQPDTVPCQIRAKRGCATHPRSIAERMRRTRISERMKKLQDLFPNMDKQTNTADMLDLAVEYIKDLQKQVQTLTDTRAKCICSSKHQESSLAM